MQMKLKAKQPLTRKQQGQQAYKSGYFAESLACLYLRFKGYRIIARNFKTPVGEIDIIAKKGNTLTFTEIKFRQNIDDARNAISPKMQQRISRAAELYLAQNPDYTQGNQNNFTLRFDFIALARPYYIEHIPNAWSDGI